MSTPRGLVCDICWDGLFNTQAYQDLFVPPSNSSSIEDQLPRKVLQETTSQHVRDNCSFVMIRRDIGRSEYLPKTENKDGEVESTTKCNWCEYIGSYTCCELDEDEKVPDYDQDLLEISLETVRVDCSTPPTDPGAGGKVLMLSMSRRDRRTNESLTGNGCMHHAYTPADDPAAEVVVSRPVRSDINSQEATEQIKAWMQECKTQECGNGGGPYEPTILPTRVIDVGLDDSRNARIVKTQDTKGVYATLSYCWGRSSNIVLSRDNIQQLQAEIDIESLPQTIKDAVHITRELSIPYLWVDALCILQDDEIEKAQEIANMQRIYSCSAVTIIASSASGAEQGFLSPPEDRNSYYKPVIIPVRLAPEKFGIMALVNLNDEVCYAEHRELISRRAWTIQEQLLAQRKLTFTQHHHTMTWSCPHSPLARAFGGSMHLPYWPGNFSGKEEDFLRETLNLSALAPNPTHNSKLLRFSDSSIDRDKALGCWMRLVTAYSARSATLQVDKLNALAGIAAQCYAPLLGPGYFAVMWECGLLRQLTWETSDYHELVIPSAGPSVTRPLLDSGLSRAPSWAWASVEGGAVKYAPFPKAKKDDEGREVEEEAEEWMSEVITVTTMPKLWPDSPYGEITPGSGRITLRTKLKRAWWHEPSSSLFRHSCAPTPSRSPISSPSEVSDEESAHPLTSSGSLSPKGEGDEGGAKMTEKSKGEDGENGQEYENGAPEEVNTEPKRNEVPTFDMITHQTISGPFKYVSPFKRVLRRTGPLPPDSDSEYDSMSDSEATAIAPDDTANQHTSHIRDRDRTWWWLVNTSPDEINAAERPFAQSWSAPTDDEVDEVDPFVVYMLPLVATSSRSWHRRSHGGANSKDQLVEGLLLVKADVHVETECDSEKIAEENTGQLAKSVLFKRIGRFHSCPKREFDKVVAKLVTII